MRVLVTGGSGFLGSWIAEVLARQGHEVRALVRKTSNTTFLESLKGVELVYGSVENARSVEDAMAGVEAVVHSAGLVKARSVAEFHDVNVQGTVNLLESAKKRARGLRRFVHVSSLEVSGPSRDGRAVPISQEEPCTAYGRSKLAAERAVLARKDDLPVVVLRPGAIYGPRDQEILEAFKSIARGLMPTVAGGSALGVFIHARDCAELCVRAIDADVATGSVYFAVDATGPVSQADFLAMIEAALGTCAKIRVSLPGSLLKAVSHGVQAFGVVTNKAVMLTPEKASMLLRDFVCDGAATREAFGWEPAISLRDGVRATAVWYREQGLL